MTIWQELDKRMEQYPINPDMQVLGLIVIWEFTKVVASRVFHRRRNKRV